MALGPRRSRARLGQRAVRRCINYNSAVKSSGALDDGVRGRLPGCAWRASRERTKLRPSSYGRLEGSVADEQRVTGCLKLQ